MLMLKKIIIGFSVASVIFLFSGCAAGKNFHYSKSDFVIDKTTESEVIAKLGSAYSYDEKTLNSVNRKNLIYWYYNPHEKSISITQAPSKKLYIYLKDGILIGEEYRSTFIEDSTDFDFTKVSQIKNGESTLKDTIALLGEAKGEFSKDLVSTKGISAGATHGVIYQIYMFYILDNMREKSVTEKTLVIEFNDKDIVVNTNAKNFVGTTPL